MDNLYLIRLVNCLLKYVLKLNVIFVKNLFALGTQTTARKKILFK